MRGGRSESYNHVNVTDTLLLCVITDVYNVSCIFRVKIILFFTV